MARYTGPKCKLCRREGMKLFLKGSRCDTKKCAVERRDYPPGPRSFRRRRISAYGQQLREKQKAKRYYGVLERQFKRFFAEAERLPGNTGQNLLVLMERRLDNVVYHLGFGTSRAHARQIVNHGHIAVNGRRVNIPSYVVTKGQTIGSHAHDRSRAFVKRNFEDTRPRSVPDWLKIDGDNVVGEVLELPTRDQVTLIVQEQLIVELCSK